MAGDWIKVEHTLPDKPEVDQLAEALGLDHDTVVGKLIRFWIWFDSQSENGNAVSVTEKLLDRITRCAGFAQELINAGWLERIDGKFTLPKFDRHNGKTAKSRGLSRNRTQHFRNARSVTDALPEKRREEKRSSSLKKEKKRAPEFVKPTLHEVQVYVMSIQAGIDPEKFLDHYEANGWRVGRSPMKSWQAAVRQWAKREGEFKPAWRNGKPSPPRKSRLPTREENSLITLADLHRTPEEAEEGIDYASRIAAKHAEGLWWDEDAGKWLPKKTNMEMQNV